MTQCFSVAAVSRGRAPKGLRATKDAINAASETLMENRHAKPRPLPSDGGGDIARRAVLRRETASKEVFSNRNVHLVDLTETKASLHDDPMRTRRWTVSGRQMTRKRL